MNKYDAAKDSELDEILKEIVSEMNASQILSYPEVYSFFKEELNNEVLDRWEIKNTKTLGIIKDLYHEMFPGRKSQTEFKDIFVKILAEAIQREGAFDSFEICGPFGLMCNYFISLKKGDNNYYFSFFEQSLDGEIGIYKPKENPENFIYEKGTIGYYNQGNLDKIVIPSRTMISELIEKYILKNENNE